MGGDSAMGGSSASAGGASSSGVDGGPASGEEPPPCDPSSVGCRRTACKDAGASCATATDCCSLRCEDNACQAEQCISDNESCTRGEECCSGTCSDAGTCTPLNLVCKTSGNTCAVDSDCCSKYCKNGTCDIAPSWCTQTGDICSYAEDCCSGSCVFAPGSPSGVCGPPPGGAGCSDKAIEGSVCGGFDDCLGCCSKLCAPDATTGVFVCQPTSGCRTEGGLCRNDSDCCGVSGSGLPGDGNGVCWKEAGSAVGVCKTSACIPQGQVCHYSGNLYACDSGSSAPNSCCGATGNSGRCVAASDGVLRCNGFEECPPGAQENDPCSLCMLDPLGIPRCNGLETCRNVGETCSNSGDCCNQLPCIPDAEGILRCAEACGGLDDSCTVDTDCCSGYTCIRSADSVSGMCGIVGCSAYGQDCTEDEDCCNFDPAAPLYGCFGGKCKSAPR